MAKYRVNSCPGLITQGNPEALPPGALRKCRNAIARGQRIEPRRPLLEYSTGPSAGGSWLGFFLAGGKLWGYATQGSTNLYLDSGDMGHGGSFTQLTVGSSLLGPQVSSPNGVYGAGFDAALYPAAMNGATFFADPTAGRGQMKLDQYDTTLGIYKAGLQKGLDLTLTPTGSSGFLTSGYTIAYKIVWGYIDNQKNTILGEPSGRFTATAGGTAQNVTVKSAIPSEIAALSNTEVVKRFYQVYRSKLPNAAGTSPTDDYYLVWQSYLTATDKSNGYVQFTDSQPDLSGVYGPALYTNGAADQGNAQAPIAQDIAVFRNTMFFANTTSKYRLDLAMLGMPDGYSLNGAGAQVQANTPVAGQATYTFASAGSYDFAGIDTSCSLSVQNCTNAGNNGDFVVVSVNTGSRQIVVTNGGAVNEAAPPATARAMCAGIQIASKRYNASFTENIASRRYAAVSGLTSTSGTLAQDLLTTSQSLIRCVNYDASNTVYADYISAVTDYPGQMRFYERSIGGSVFTVQGFGNKVSAASGAPVYAAKFAPDINQALSAKNDVAPNRLYRSKTSEPEHVPLAYYEDIGLERTSGILRIVALRDSLLIFKQDGLYICTGVPGNFQYRLVDSTLVLASFHGLAVLKNTCFVATKTGLYAIADGGYVKQLDVPVRPTLAIHFGALAGYGSLITTAHVSASQRDNTVCFALYTKDNSTTDTVLLYDAAHGTFATATPEYGGPMFHQPAAQFGMSTFWPSGVNGGGAWTEEVQNPNDATSVGSATIGLVPPGDRRLVNVTSRSNPSTIVVAAGNYVPVVGDIIVGGATSLFRFGSYWQITNVSGGGPYTLTVTAYATTGGDTVTGTIPVGNAWIVRPQDVEVEFHPFTAGADGTMKRWSDCQVLMTPESNAQNVTLAFSTEVDLTTESINPSPNQKNYSVWSLVPQGKQYGQRLTLNVKHQERMRYFVIEGVTLNYEPVKGGIPLG